MKAIENIKEYVCNNDIINNYFKREDLQKQYNWRVDIDRNHIKEHLQLVFANILEDLDNCDLFNLKYSFNYIDNDYSQILQVTLLTDYSDTHCIECLDKLQNNQNKLIEEKFKFFFEYCISVLKGKKDLSLIKEFYKDKYKNYGCFYDIVKDMPKENVYQLKECELNFSHYFVGDNFVSFTIVCTDE